MKNDQYFRHDASAAGNRKLMNLLDDYGTKGYGAYWLLLEALRMQKGYKAPLSLLAAVARRARVRIPFLLKVINHYDLFVVENGCFYSSGMTQRMRSYDVKKAQTCDTNSNKTGDNTLIISKTDPYNARKEEKKEKREERIEEEKTASAAPVFLRSKPEATVGKEGGWEACIDSAFREESWVEIQAIHSGLGRMFTAHRQEIVGFFKLHVRTYGKETTLCCVNDAKSYFSNFIRPGSPTQKNLLTELIRQAELRKKENPYRHETRDPASGQRMYCGQIIPRDAPPRPDACAVWDEALHRWGR